MSSDLYSFFSDCDTSSISEFYDQIFNETEVNIIK
jgi:hypothetical protein